MEPQDQTRRLDHKARTMHEKCQTQWSDEFTSKVAKTMDEARELIEAGFQYVTDMDEVKILRKRE